MIQACFGIEKHSVVRNNRATTLNSFYDFFLGLHSYISISLLKGLRFFKNCKGYVYLEPKIILSNFISLAICRNFLLCSKRKLILSNVLDINRFLMSYILRNDPSFLIIGNAKTVAQMIGWKTDFDTYFFLHISAFTITCVEDIKTV